MKELLFNLIGKTVDVYCGGSASLRGEVIKVEDEVVHLRDSEDKICFVSLNKIIVVWEASDEEHRAGFVSKP